MEIIESSTESVVIFMVFFIIFEYHRIVSIARDKRNRNSFEKILPTRNTSTRA